MEFEQVIRYLNWNESASMAFFEGGLKEDIKDILCMKERLSTLQALMEEAVKIDSRLHKRGLEPPDSPTQGDLLTQLHLFILTLL